MKSLSKHPVFLLLLLLVAFTVNWVAYQYIIDYSRVTTALLLVAVGLVLIALIDKFLFRGVRVLELIEEGNVAVALALAGFLIFVGLCFGAV